MYVVGMWHFFQTTDKTVTFILCTYCTCPSFSANFVFLFSFFFFRFIMKKNKMYSGGVVYKNRKVKKKLN